MRRCHSERCKCGFFRPVYNVASGTIRLNDVLGAANEGLSATRFLIPLASPSTHLRIRWITSHHVAVCECSVLQTL
jgi:hypothetical protein